VARSITSSLLSYLTVGALTVGTIIAFSLILPFTRVEIQYPSGDGNTYTSTTQDPSEIWWIMAPNPFVILADSAPRVPPRYVTVDDQVFTDDYDPLSELGREVRNLRQQRMPYDYSGDQPAPPPVWPWGLGFDVLVGVAAVWVTTRRLTAPSSRIASGVRIA
jgi:hypothetical protein